ncbi:hypothetical protein K501DRAFT_272003 [Backusella circina FSU 941]|nr:hypothetical protein K501DRAFT_272003 [Backusella circina FSU 941]
MSSGSATLECKICRKLFPKYDQRGYRNAGFTAHQNRCIERESILASSPVKTPVKRRRLLPAPPKDNVSESFTPTQKQGGDAHTDANPPPTSTINACTAQHGEPNPSSQQSTSTNDFQPVLRCDYCEPENGVHQVNCSIIRFVRDNFDIST